jgi:hypothetical protein
MIVSSFIPAVPGTGSGMGLSGPAPKSAQQDSSASDFSSLIQVSDSPAQVDRAAKIGPRRATGTAETAASRAERKDGPETVASPASGASVEPRSDRGSSNDSSAAFSSPLETEAPLPRDPRLDDPLELALEAAAIALASSIVQQQPQVAPPLALSDESQLGANADQGSANFSQEEPSLASDWLSPLTALKTGSDQPNSTVEGLPKNPTGQPVEILVKTAMEEAMIVGQPKVEQPSRSASSSQITRVVPKIVPTALVSTVVVEADPSQVAALANSSAAIALSDRIAADADAADVLLLQKRTDDLTGADNGVAVLPGADVQSGLTATDDAFLVSANPENPAAAFFAAKPDARTSEAPPVDSPADDGNASASDLTALSVGSSTDLQVGRDQESGSGNRSRGDSEGGSNLEHRNGLGSLAGGDSAEADRLDAEGLSTIGTFGAEEGGVEARPLVIAAPVDERSALTVVSEDDSFPQGNALTEGLEFSGTQKAAIQSGTQPSVVRATSSKPTVLPPVDARSADLANVIHRALERARSENPSHLAVEVRLEDGSSFGLEVRMNAAGLQASFRSESQPLLRALENNWATFIAREAADQKMVSAAFEGRSGFGGLSDNNSDASDRRERMEDNASSALLGAFNPKNLSPGKSQIDTQSVPVAAQRGMALYA